MNLKDFLSETNWTDYPIKIEVSKIDGYFQVIINDTIVHLSLIDDFNLDEVVTKALVFSLAEKLKNTNSLVA